MCQWERTVGTSSVSASSAARARVPVPIKSPGATPALVCCTTHHNGRSTADQQAGDQQGLFERMQLLAVCLGKKDPPDQDKGHRGEDAQGRRYPQYRPAQEGGKRPLARSSASRRNNSTASSASSQKARALRAPAKSTALRPAK